MMLVVLGGGGLEKRTTPTLLHDERQIKQQRLLSDDDDTAVLFGGGYIEREVKDYIVFCVCDDFLLEKRDVPIFFFFKLSASLSSLFFSIVFFLGLSLSLKECRHTKNHTNFR